MKNKQLLTLLVLLLVAATITDDTTNDFSQGTTIGVNISNDEITIEQQNNQYSSGGEYRSQIYDLGSNPEGTISWNQETPPETGVLVLTRSGPEASITNEWTSWSNPYNNPDGSNLANQQNRYWQYRAQLTTQNNSVTPTIHNITINYEEQGPIINKNQDLTEELTEHSNTTYYFYIDIRDTLELTSTTGRYHNGSGIFTPWEPLDVHEENTTYYLQIPEPTNGWQALAGEELTIQISAQNNDHTTEETYLELVTAINDPPTIQGISDRPATEGEELMVVVNAQDPDGDTLTYTTSHGTITKITNEQAELRWTPTRTDVGKTNITVTVSDGEFSDETNFTVDTTLFNHQPQLRAVNNQTGYYDDTIQWTAIADNQNINDNLTFSSNPALNWEEANNTETTEYVATATLRALDDYKGTTQFTFRVEDEQGETSTTTAYLEIAYCGDNICQVNENATSCPQDCRQPSSPSYLALELENRICENQTTTIIAFNASSRYTCFYEGRTVSSAAYCHPTRDAELEIYKQQSTGYEEQTTLTTDEQGAATYTPPQTGRYRVIATQEGLITAEKIFTAGTCSTRTSDEGIIEYARPNITAQPRPQQTPRRERPEVTEEDLNLFAIFIFYVLIPLIAAGSIYTGAEYYEKHKDTDKTLLRMRVAYAELRTKTDPYWKPLWKQIKNRFKKS